MAKTILYIKPTCPYCIAAVQLLDQKGVDYESIDVASLSRDELDELQNKAHGHQTVPKIFIDGRFVGGYDELNTLEKNGKLDTLLNA